MNGSSQWKFRKLYSTLGPVVKMKPNKLLAAQIITLIHARRGRAVKLKSARYQLDDDNLRKRNFENNIWKQCIQSNAISYRYFHKTTGPREKDAIKHPSKSRS